MQPRYAQYANICNNMHRYMQIYAKYMQNICMLYAKICKNMDFLCRNMQSKYAKICIEICKICISPYFAYIAFIWTPDFADGCCDHPIPPALPRHDDFSYGPAAAA